MVDFKELAKRLAQANMEADAKGLRGHLMEKFRLVNGTIHASGCTCKVCRAVPHDEWERDAFTDSEGRRTLTPEEALHGTDPFDLTEEEKKYNDMITTTRSNPTQGNSTPRGVQFLSPKHVTTPEGLVLQITEVTTDEPDNFGNPYVVYFQNGRDKYSKGFSPTHSLLHALVDMFGEDEKKWTGSQLRVTKQVTRGGAERLVFGPARKSR